MRSTTFKTQILTLSLFALVTLAVQSAEAATFHFLGGVQDNYALPTEPINPSPSLQTFLGTNTYSSYDTFLINQRFADTFAGLPMCITKADLHIALRPLAGVGQSSATNDTLRFNFTNNAGQQVGPYWIEFIGYQGQEALLQTNWGSQNFYPNGVNFWLDLGAMPIGNFNFNGNTANLIPAMNLYKHLNVDVQDDTEVDYIDLKIVTALAGDMNGDGCVDAKDLNVLVANFGQVTPAGVGDPNGDGTIDILDLNLVQADFGKCCPEPSSLACCAAALLGVLVCGRRQRTMAYIPTIAIARGVPFAAVLAAGVALGTTASANGPFSFVKIADTSTIIPNGPGGAFTDLFPPAVSGGKVAFRGYGATTSGNTDWTGIITDQPGTLTRVAQGLSSTGNAILYDPSIDGSTIAYHQTSPFGQTTSVINTWTGGVSTPIAGKGTIAPPGGSGTFDILERPSIDNGKVAFKGWASPPALGGIFSNANGPLANVIREGTSPVPPTGIDTFSFVVNPDYDASQIVFHAQTSSGGQGIYRALPTTFGAITRVVDSTMLVPGTTATFSLLSNVPSFDGSDVSFSSFYSGGNGIFRTSGGSLLKVADWSTPVPGGTGNFNLLYGDTAIDQDLVAFLGRSSGIQKGLYLHDVLTSQLCEVLAAGDTLDNKTVRDLAIGREALDANKLGVWVQFTDNSEGVYLFMVPEPTSAAILSIGAYGLVGVGLRRRRVRRRLSESPATANYSMSSVTPRLPQ